MKVVVFCGELDMRLRESEGDIPKTIVRIDHLAVLWRLLKYYAGFGHKDFILCVGRYSRDNSQGGSTLNGNHLVLHDTSSIPVKDLESFQHDLRDWNVTFVDGGLHSDVAQALKAAEKYLAGEQAFLANYADDLRDISLPNLLQFAREHDKIATCVCATPYLFRDVVSSTPDGVVTAICSPTDAALWVNTGFFVFKKEIFNYIQDGEDLLGEPFARLIKEEQLIAYRHDGAPASMSDLKDKDQLEQDDASGQSETPWILWENFSAR